MIVAAIASIILSGIRLFIEVFQMFKLGMWNYLRSWVNWIELILFTFSIIFVIVFLLLCNVSCVPIYCILLYMHVHKVTCTYIKPNLPCVPLCINDACDL